MSRMTCLIIFSGSSARSTRSFRFARTSAATRSSSAIADSFPEKPSPRRQAASFSPMPFTRFRSSDICMPESASKSAGTCAAIFVRSPVIL